MTSYNYTLTAYDARQRIRKHDSRADKYRRHNTANGARRICLTVINQSTIALSWLASTDNVTLPATRCCLTGRSLERRLTGVVLTGLPPAEARSYTVRAIDHAGLRSTSTAPLLASPTDDTSVALLDKPFLPLSRI